MHRARRKRIIKGTGGHDKTAVMGLLERPRWAPHSLVRTTVLDDVTQRTMQAHVWANVEEGANLYTDRHWGYYGLSAKYMHEVIDHVHEYVRGRIHHQRDRELLVLAQAYHRRDVCVD